MTKLDPFKHVLFRIRTDESIKSVDIVVTKSKPVPFGIQKREESNGAGLVCVTSRGWVLYGS